MNVNNPVRDGRCIAPGFNPGLMNTIQKTSARMVVMPNWFIGGWATKLPREARACLTGEGRLPICVPQAGEWELGAINNCWVAVFKRIWQYEAEHRNEGKNDSDTKNLGTNTSPG